MRALFRTLCAAAVLSACGLPTTTPRDVGDGTVLFVGNSLTYWNDLPSIVEALARASGAHDFEARAVVAPNADLEEHIASGDALRAIRKGGWAAVVLQQGPSAVEVNREQLRATTRVLAAEITRAGARPALFAAWPAAARRDDFARAAESYALAASDVDGLLLPVSSAWLAAWRRAPTLALYSADGLHPSVQGSYLAALVIAGGLLGQSPRDMPSQVSLSNGARISLPEETAELLRAAAAEALEQASGS